MTTWKRDFASGLIVVVPILVISYLLFWMFGVLSSLPFITLEIEGLPPIQTEILQVLLLLALFAVVVLSVGYFMRTRGGQFLEHVLDDLINRVPLLRIVYNASKLAVETALTGTEELQKPVKIEPWNGIRMTAFKTGKRTEDGREVLFMPTAPNITTGFVIEVESEDITETDEKVEEALTRILSAGFGESNEGVPIDVVDEGDGDSRRVD